MEDIMLSVPLGGTKLAVFVNGRAAEMRRDWDTKRHCNAEYELHVILEGGCTLDVDDAPFALLAGTAALVAPGAYHLPTLQPGGFDRFSLAFSPPEGRLGASLAKAVRSCATSPLPPEALDACRDFYREAAASLPFREELLQLLAARLLICVFRALEVWEPLSSARGERRKTSPRTMIIDDFFEKNFVDSSGEAALAALLHLSRRQLARVLREHYGVGFREKLLQARMDHAGWLLRSTDKRVSEISALAGYSSEAAFFKAFREHYATTPLKYRRASGRPGTESEDSGNAGE